MKYDKRTMALIAVVVVLAIVAVLFFFSPLNTYLLVAVQKHNSLSVMMNVLKII